MAPPSCALFVVDDAETLAYSRDLAREGDDDEVGPSRRARARGAVFAKTHRRFDSSFSFATQATEGSTTRGLEPHVRDFVARAALDVADERARETNATYLRVVDRFDDVDAHAYATATRCRMILLTSRRGLSGGDEGVRMFFADAHEAYARALMNPMSGEVDGLGESFDRAVRRAAARRFGLPCS